MKSSPRSGFDSVAASMSDQPENGGRRTSGDFRFTLLTLFAGLTLSCFFAAALANFGALRCLILVGSILASLIAVTPIALFWGLFYRICPLPTKYVTVFALLGFVLLAPLPVYLLHSREIARRNSLRHQLKDYGSELRQFMVTFPSPDDARYNNHQQLHSDFMSWKKLERAAQEESGVATSAKASWYEP